MVLTSNQRSNSQPVHKYVIRLVRVGEQLGGHKQLGIHLARSVQHVLGHMQWRRVAIVKANAVEHSRRRLYVFLHVTPQEWAVGWFVAEPM